MSGTRPILEARGIRRRFGAVQALDGVDLTLWPGEIHALLGENGAGKSTLLGILAGDVIKDGGELRLDGTTYEPKSPREARDRGLATIHQELALAPHLSIEDNVHMGSGSGLLAQRPRSRGGVRDALTALGHPGLDPRTRVDELSPAERQVVEISRALITRSRILILDEPTSSLTRSDIDRLFATLRRLRSEGVAILYVSHFLEEVSELADRTTILRDGRTVSTARASGVMIDSWIRDMIGRSLDEAFPRVPHRAQSERLLAEGLTGADDLPRDVDLTVAGGEIVGLGGLVGSGRTELLRTLFGLRPTRRGQVRCGDHELTRASPARRCAVGLGFLSEDRKGEGLLLDRSVSTNIVLSSLSRRGRFGLRSVAREQSDAAAWIERLRITGARPDTPVRALSGGNQQKVALARLLEQDAKVLLLDEPTRGIDVGSKAEIYRRLGEEAAAGRAILMVSSSFEELLGVADRVAVVHRGRLTPFRDASRWKIPELLEMATLGRAVP